MSTIALIERLKSAERKQKAVTVALEPIGATKTTMLRVSDACADAATELTTLLREIDTLRIKLTAAGMAECDEVRDLDQAVWQATFAELTARAEKAEAAKDHWCKEAQRLLKQGQDCVDSLELAERQRDEGGTWEEQISKADAKANEAEARCKELEYIRSHGYIIHLSGWQEEIDKIANLNTRNAMTDKLLKLDQAVIDYERRLAKAERQRDEALKALQAVTGTASYQTQSSNYAVSEEAIKMVDAVLAGGKP